MTKRRYAVCGVSQRAIGMYIKPMLDEFTHCAELVALLDIDPLRFKVCKEQAPKSADVPEYLAADFDKMIAGNKSMHTGQPVQRYAYFSLTIA